MRIVVLSVAAAVMAAGMPGAAAAAEIKVLTAGAFKQVLLALVPEFEKQTGHKVTLANDTVGALTKRIEGGEAFDLAVLTPAAVNELANKGKIAAGSRVNLARVGVGVVVREGAPKPDISSVDAFKRALLDAKSVAYVEQGGTGIYLKALLVRLGIADALKDRVKALPPENPAAHAVANGEAEIGMTQISEILPYAGAELVGPFPSEIQLTTTFATAVGAAAQQPEAAKALIKFLTAPAAAAVFKAKGLDPAG